jgi:hypothetical protein
MAKRIRGYRAITLAGLLGRIEGGSAYLLALPDRECAADHLQHEQSVYAEVLRARGHAEVGLVSADEIATYVAELFGSPYAEVGD